MPLILPSNTITGGYEVANSLRFDDGSSDYLSRTAGSTGNRKTFTISYWGKRGNLTLGGTSTALSSGDFSTGDNHTYVGFQLSTDTARIQNTVSGSTVMSLISSALYRDVSAWYHFVWKVDTTQATESDRVKLYVNGVEQTISGTYPTQNQDTFFGYADTYRVGVRFIAQSTYWDGYLSEVCYVDGTALDATSFGEFDEDSGIWKPIDVSGLTFGTNGFYLPFENSSALGQDDSGNGNNFTVNNLTSDDQTVDTPTNNFATLNPLGFGGTTPTFSQGNLNATCGSGVSLYSISTIGVSSGKWYCEGEIEQATLDGGLYYVDFGFHDRADSAGQALYVSNGRMFWHSSWDGKINYRTGGSTTAGLVTGLATFTPGDFFQLYLDMDNELMYWGKNGSLLNTTGVSFNGKESLTGEYFFAFGDQFTSGTHEYAVNFGQGSIDGVAVSNYQDANGYGNFKYNPTVTTDEGSKDFLALCTKNLAEFG